MNPPASHRVGLSKSLKRSASLLLALNPASGWHVADGIRFGKFASKHVKNYRLISAVEMKGFGGKGFSAPPKRKIGTQELLRLVPYDDPVLRIPADVVEFPLSGDDSKLVKNMLYSVKTEQLKKAGVLDISSAAGMAAPQWGKPRRIFVWRKEFLKDAEGGQGVSGGMFVVAINPEYKPLAEDDTGEISEVEGWEGCFSVPGKQGKVRRFRRIEAKFQSRDNQNFTVLLEDWPARVFQHETDHLNGKTYDDETMGRCSRLVDMAPRKKRVDALNALAESGKIKDQEEYERRHDEIMMTD